MMGGKRRKGKRGGDWAGKVNDCRGESLLISCWVEWWAYGGIEGEVETGGKRRMKGKSSWECEEKLQSDKWWEDRWIEEGEMGEKGRWKKSSKRQEQSVRNISFDDGLKNDDWIDDGWGKEQGDRMTVGIEMSTEKEEKKWKAETNGEKRQRNQDEQEEKEKEKHSGNSNERNHNMLTHRWMSWREMRREKGRRHDAVEMEK